MNDRLLSRIFWWSLLLAAAVVALARPHGPARSVAGPSAGLIAWEEAELVSPDVVAGDQFGYAVSVSGDTAVVGAYWSTVGGAEKVGAAYVFTRPGPAGAWTQAKRLTASDGAAFDQFGAAVATDGDTVVVGATGADVGGESNQGAAYLFARDEGGAGAWGEVTKLTSPEGGSFDNFGDSVAVQGEEVFVGAKDADVNGGSGRGAVFVFGRDEGGAGAWGSTGRLVDPEGRSNDSFGSALAVAGAWLVAGAERADVGGLYENEGAALLFQKDAGSGAWGFFKRLAAGDGAGSDRFGASVATDGARVLVGAPGATVNGAFMVGKAYLFERDAGGAENWGEVKMLVAGDGNAFDGFGGSVAVGADGGGGGVAYVGAGAADVALADEGAVYAFAEDDGGVGNWGEAAKIAPGAGQAGEQFGHDIALAGQTLVAGAHNAAAGAGRAYVYTAVGTPELSSSFLPLVAAPALPTTGTLVDGGVVAGPGGVKLGAVPGALADPLPVSLLAGSAPADPLPENATPVGDYYLIGAGREVVQPLSTAFVLALPVPPGADVTRLGVAVHASMAGLLDQDKESGFYWALLPGVYDPAADLLLAQLPTLLPAGNTLTLVEHPDMATPEKGSGGGGAVGRYGHGDATGGPGPAAPAITNFVVLCTHVGCLDSLKQEVAQELVNNYFDFSANYGYPEPRLQGPSLDLGIDPPVTGTPSGTYYAGIMPKGDPACKNKDGDPTAGMYNPRHGDLYLCVQRGVGSLPAWQQSTVRHEYFHALEYAHDQALADWTAGRRESWITEGMAETAEESGNSWVRSGDNAVRVVDRGLRDTADALAYRAEDFWVFYGNNLVVGGLERLKPILEKGVTYDAVIAETIFGDAYTLWGRNQALEKNDDMDGALGNACELEEAAVSNLLLYDLGAPNPLGYFPGSTGILETTVVELTFPADWQGNPARIALLPLNSGETIPYWFDWKVYRTPADNCSSTPENVAQEYVISPNERYFVVMSNWGDEDAFDWRLLAE